MEPAQNVRWGRIVQIELRREPVADRRQVVLFAFAGFRAQVMGGDLEEVARGVTGLVRERPLDTSVRAFPVAGLQRPQAGDHERGGEPPGLGRLKFGGERGGVAAVRSCRRLDPGCTAGTTYRRVTFVNGVQVPMRVVASAASAAMIEFDDQMVEIKAKRLVASA